MTDLVSETIVWSPLNVTRIFVVLVFWYCISLFGRILYMLYLMKRRNPPRGPMPPIKDIAMLHSIMAFLLILLVVSRTSLVLRNIQPQDYTLVISLPVIACLLPPILHRQIKHYQRILNGFGGKSMGE